MSKIPPPEPWNPEPEKDETFVPPPPPVLIPTMEQARAMVAVVKESVSTSAPVELIISFGPETGKFMLTADGAGRARTQVVSESTLREILPILKRLVPIKDLTGGALNERKSAEKGHGRGAEAASNNRKRRTKPSTAGQEDGATG
jgi:hypothetical protein